MCWMVHNGPWTICNQLFYSRRCLKLAWTQKWKRGLVILLTMENIGNPWAPSLRLPRLPGKGLFLLDIMRNHFYDVKRTWVNFKNIKNETTLKCHEMKKTRAGKWSRSVWWFLLRLEYAFNIFEKWNGNASDQFFNLTTEPKPQKREVEI